MSDIFDEVDEELRAEKASALFKRYGGALVAACVLAVAAVAGWEAWKAHQARENARVSALYAAASAAAASPAARDAARADFDKVIAEGAAGYRTLARLREAGLAADAGKPEDALALWDAVAADSAADPLLRDIARLHWASHQVDSGDPAAVAAHLAPVTAPGNPLRPLAEETEALLNLRIGKTDAARDTLRRLAQDVTAPEGVRGRANGLLAQIGG